MSESVAEIPAEREGGGVGWGMEGGGGVGVLKQGSGMGI